MKFAQLKIGDWFKYKGMDFIKTAYSNRVNAMTDNLNGAYFGDNRRVEK